MHRSLVVALVVCSVGLVAWFARGAAEEKYPDISIKDLKKAIDKHTVTVIDANGTESYTDGHIPGAINFATDADKLAAKLPKDKDALVVAYCGGPQCMAYKAAAEKAVALGYTNVKHLSAGISGWKEAGEKVEK
jgi:rhodanese-related sulfurtransferase